MKKKTIIIIFIIIIFLTGCFVFYNKKDTKTINRIKSKIEDMYSIKVKNIKKTKSVDIGKLQLKGAYEVTMEDGKNFYFVEIEACDGFNKCSDYLSNYANIKTNELLKDYQNAKIVDVNNVSKYLLGISADEKSVEELYNEYKEILNKISALKNYMFLYYAPSVQLTCNVEDNSQVFYTKYFINKEDEIIDDINLEGFTEKYNAICDPTTDNNQKIKITADSATIELSKANESLAVNNSLYIDFIGKQTETDMYEYIANIYFNGVLVENNLFNNTNKKSIWSSNYAANFKVEKVNNLYFIISSIAKQQDGDYILILNDGKVVDTFTDVKILLDKENKLFEISDCTTSNTDEACTKSSYNILDNSIIKK